VTTTDSERAEWRDANEGHTWTRGRFLAGSAAAVSAGIVPGIARAAARDQSDYGSWEAVRSAFPLSRDARHFTAFLLSPHPAPIAAAIETYRREIDRDPDGYLFAHEEERRRQVLRAASQYVGAPTNEIALTDSTTMGLGLLYGGLRLSPGDELLTSTHDFYSTHESLRLSALRSGATVRKVDLYRRLSRVSIEEIVSTLRKSIRPRTRVVALTWVHSSTGLKLPVREIARALDQVNADRNSKERVLFCVDGVHGFGLEDVAIATLGCDFFVSGCHKWLFGPRGTGLIWGARSAWARTSPTIPTFDPPGILNWIRPDARAPAPPGPAMTPGGFHSFEHRWALRQAFEFHTAIGRKRIAERTHSLAHQLKEGLARMPHVILRTPRSTELSAGLVCFELKTLDAPAAVEDLKSRRILASVSPYATQYVRFGPSIVNTPDDIDVALRAIRSLR
jgi:isopenicillin-N epimerase